MTGLTIPKDDDSAMSEVYEFSTGLILYTGMMVSLMGLL